MLVQIRTMGTEKRRLIIIALREVWLGQEAEAAYYLAFCFQEPNSVVDLIKFVGSNGEAGVQEEAKGKEVSPGLKGRERSVAGRVVEPEPQRWKV